MNSQSPNNPLNCQKAYVFLVAEILEFQINYLPPSFQTIYLQFSDNHYYNKIFEEVYSICSELNIDNIISVIPETCGVYYYKQTKSRRYIFKLYRTAQKNVQLDTTKQLHILRKTEFYQFFKIKAETLKKKDLIEIAKQRYDDESINRVFKQILKKRFEKQWMFLKQNYKNIYEIDYQWFYKNQIEPSRIYK